MTTAKNRALDVLRRDRTARTFAPELGRLLESEWTLAPVVEELFRANMIKDGQLRMMFSCCHPRLPEDGQVAVILNLLCGFSVDEIASAFLNSHAATEKRISRAKKVLGASKKLFEISGSRDFLARLAAVHRALYLLFNEGYHGASPESAVRNELCHEAMRLTALLHEHALSSTPATYALSALMCLHAARLPSRLDASGNLSTFLAQDRSKWDQQLITEGQYFLERSASGDELTEYHLEAAIASLHAMVTDIEKTDWRRIPSLYDTLVRICPSPVVALNRAIAVAQLEGPERGLEELWAIRDADRLAAYPFYAATHGELELRRGHFDSAREHLREAIALARSDMERRFLENRMNACEDT